MKSGLIPFSIGIGLDYLVPVAETVFLIPAEGLVEKVTK